MTLIRAVNVNDLSSVARVHKDSFSRQEHSSEWIGSTFAAYPRFRFFLADVAGAVAGYIVWGEKSGFRREVVLELEQMAVLPDFRSNGVGKALIRKSFSLVEDALKQRDATVKAVLVTTRTDNHAQALYKSVLGAEQRAVVKDLYSADEAIMVATAPFP